MRIFPREYIYRRLKELNKTIESFAFDAVLNPRYVAKILSGERGNQIPVLTLFRIAESLDWPIQTLMYQERDYQLRKKKWNKSLETR